MEKQNPPFNSGKLPLARQILASFLRSFFNLLYHPMAWTYDWVAAIVSVGSWKTWVEEIANYVEGPRALEIGYGPGHVQAALIHKGITTFGVDESAEMSRIAYKRLVSLGLNMNLTRGDALNLPFADQSFNQVVLTFPSEFILNPNALQEIHRVLSDAGLAIILPLAWITGHRLAERLAAWINNLTGEAPEWNEKLLDPWKGRGFDINWEMLQLRASKILIIKMAKS
jgi:ubiquinone/menaquinone biosynthesis C-methylase UbiE